MNRIKSLGSALLLLLTAIIWGTAFVSQVSGMYSVGAFTFSASRNVLGAVILVPVILIMRIRKRGFSGKKPYSMKTTILAGVICGIVLTAANLFQQFGLMTTTVGKGGFITSLYIIFTPVLGLLVGRKVSLPVWFCVAAAAFGFYLLCINEDFSVGIGDILVFICSVIFAVHILVIDHFSSKIDGIMTACIQLAVCALISGLLAFIFEKPSIDQIIEGIIPILYAGVLSSGVAYTLQIIGQRDLNPTVAALIMSLESVISSAAGYFAYQFGILKEEQTMTSRQIIGCIIIFTAVVAVQLPFPDRKKKAVINDLTGLKKE